MYISQNYSYAILRPLQAEILAQGGEVKWFLEGDNVNPDFLKSDEKTLNSIHEIINGRLTQPLHQRTLSLHFFPERKWLCFTALMLES